MSKFFKNNFLVLPSILSMLIGCSSPQYQEIYSSINKNFFGDDVIITKNFYDQQPFSFAKLRLGRMSSIIIVLWKVDSGKYHWVSSDGIEIVTFNGKIIETVGMKYDIQLKMSNPIPFNPKIRSKMNGLANFFEPEALLLPFISELSLKGSKSIQRLDKDITVSVFEEDQSINAIKFKAKNTYFLNTFGEVIKVIQTIHPYEDQIEIEFYLK